MSFKIAYTFLANDNFTAAQKKINRSVKKFNVAMRKSIRDTKKSTKAMRNFGKSVKDAGKKMSLFATLPIAFAFKKFIDMASDAEETANKFGEVFKGIDATSGRAVRGLAKDFGLATSTSQELLSNTGDLLVGLGLSREKALELSESVVRLSTDVGSFKNVDTERAATSLTKALLGERESLKETFKTAVSEQEVKERAIKIAMKTRGLTERQAKAMATLQIVTERNKDAIGDFARTQNSYANQTKISNELSKEMAESFGQLMLPAAIAVRKIMIKVIKTINDFSPTTKKVLLIILAIVAVIGPLLVVIGLLASGIAALTTVASAFGVVMGVISLPVIAIIAAIGLLVTAVVMVWKNWDGIIGGLKLMWEDLSSFIIERGIKILNAIKDFLIAPMKIAGKVLGFLGAEQISNAIEEIDRKLTIGGDINNSSKSQTDINVSVKGTPGSITEATSKTQSTGRSPNVGFNVIQAGKI